MKRILCVFLTLSHPISAILSPWPKGLMTVNFFFFVFSVSSKKIYKKRGKTWVMFTLRVFYYLSNVATEERRSHNIARRVQIIIILPCLLALCCVLAIDGLWVALWEWHGEDEKFPPPAHVVNFQLCYERESNTWNCSCNSTAAASSHSNGSELFEEIYIDFSAAGRRYGWERMLMIGMGASCLQQVSTEPTPSQLQLNVSTSILD